MSLVAGWIAFCATGASGRGSIRPNVSIGVDFVVSAAFIIATAFYGLSHPWSWTQPTELNDRSIRYSWMPDQSTERKYGIAIFSFGVALGLVLITLESKNYYLSCCRLFHFALFLIACYQKSVGRKPNTSNEDHPPVSQNNIAS